MLQELMNVAVISGEVTVEARKLQLQPLTELEGEMLTGVRIAEQSIEPWMTVQLVEFDVGGGLPMHTVPTFAFCQVLSGRGKIGFPERDDIDFEAPHSISFAPGALHSWHSIIEPTTVLCLLTKDEAS